jgi:hypothetical protein
VINKTLSSFKDEKKLMIGIKKSFDGKEHWYYCILFHFFFNSISSEYIFKLLQRLYYCQYGL